MAIHHVADHPFAVDVRANERADDDDGDDVVALAKMHPLEELLSEESDFWPF